MSQWASHLAKFNLPDDLLDSSLDRWSFFLRNAPMLDNDSLPPALAQEPQIQQASDELSRIAQSDQERERYLSRKMRQMDDQARLDDAYEKGMLIGEIRTRQQAMSQKVSPSQELRNQSFAELEQMLSELRSRQL